MSVPRALRRFLGLAPGSDDRALLGLPSAPAPISAAQVHAALSDRLQRISRHPAGNGHDAKVVRRILRDAASRLEEGLGGPASRATGASGIGPASSRIAPSGRSAPPLEGDARSGSGPAVADAGGAGSGPGSSPIPPREHARPIPPRGHPMARALASERSRGPSQPLRPDPRARAPLAGPRALTPFDRMVLAVLVSNGGWNARSRARLVAVAAQRGVGVEGLVRIVGGLAEHVRTGGGRPSTGDLHEGARMLVAERIAPQPSRLEVIVEQVAEAMGEELRSERWGPRLRVTAIFSVLSLAMLAVLVRLILIPGGTADGQRDAASPSAATSSATPNASGGTAGGAYRQGQPAGTSTTAPALAAADPNRRGDAPGVLPAKFSRPPNFAGERQPPGALRLLEQSAGLPALIESAGRRAIVAGPGFSQAVERDWVAAIEEAGGCWPLMDPRLRESVVGAFVETLRSVDHPASAERLLSPFRKRSTGQGATAIWSNAFRSGVLAEVVARASIMPPGLVAAANEGLREGLADAGARSGPTSGTERPADDSRRPGGADPQDLPQEVPASPTEPRTLRSFGFASGAAARLDAAIPALVADLVAAQRAIVDERSSNPRGASAIEPAAPQGATDWANAWEGWITAQRAVRSGTELQQAYVAVATAILRSGMDLTITGPGSDVLGRLVNPLLDFNQDPGVRRALLEWFEDPRIGSDALWVLSSMMLRHAGIAWFKSDLLVDWSADAARRRDLGSAVARRWPPPTPSEALTRPAIAISGDLLGEWRSALRGVEGKAVSARAPAEMLRTLHLASTLNEAAAAFEVGQEPRARDLIRQVRSAVDASADARDWPPRADPLAGAVGVPSGVDGEWTRQLEGAERNLEQRLAVIRHLRTRPGGDLGPRDAEVFMREVVRGSPAEVRSVARAVLLESFRQGPNVILELLDQLPEANPTEELSQIIGELTGSPLPAARSPEWVKEARLALLTHLLGLRRGPDVAIDVLAGAIGESMRARISLLPRVVAEPPRGNAPPQAILARLVDGWRERAGGMVMVAPVPAPLAELDRRRVLRKQVSSGALTLFVAEQIAHLELLAAVLAAQAPWLAPPIADLVQQASEERRQATSALAQALLTEVATARLWELAFAGPETSSALPSVSAPREEEKTPSEDGGMSQPEEPEPGSPLRPRRPVRDDAPVTPRDPTQIPPPGVEPPQRAPPIRR